MDMGMDMRIAALINAAADIEIALKKEEIPASAVFHAASFVVGRLTDAVLEARLNAHLKDYPFRENTKKMELRFLSPTNVNATVGKNGELVLMEVERSRREK